MFKKLYRYIFGVNSLRLQIPMTKPVSNKITPLANDRHDHEMCIWLGSQWEDKMPPEPLDRGLYVQTQETMIVFVRKFGGWALSHNDWLKQKAKLTKGLLDDVDVASNFYTAAFDSPWARGERRNEVWVRELKS